MPGEMRASSYEVIQFHSPTRPGYALDLEDFKSVGKSNYLELDERLIAPATSPCISRESLPMAREGFGGRVLRCVELPSSRAWEDTDFSNYRDMLSIENIVSIRKFRETIEKAASYSHASIDVAFNTYADDTHKNSVHLCQRMIRHVVSKLENASDPGSPHAGSKHDMPTGFLNVLTVRNGSRGNQLSLDDFKLISKEMSIRSDDSLLIDSEARMMYRSYSPDLRRGTSTAINSMSLRQLDPASREHERKLRAHALDHFINILQVQYGDREAMTALEQAKKELGKADCNDIPLTKELIRNTLEYADKTLDAKAERCLAALSWGITKGWSSLDRVIKIFNDEYGCMAPTVRTIHLMEQIEKRYQEVRGIGITYTQGENYLKQIYTRLLPPPSPPPSALSPSAPPPESLPMLPPYEAPPSYQSAMRQEKSGAAWFDRPSTSGHRFTEKRE